MSTGLEILDIEIERLLKQQTEGALEFVDVKRLEILLKCRQLLLGQPTEIVEKKENYSHIKNQEILSYLKGKRGKGKPKYKRKRRSKASLGKRSTPI